MKEQSRNWQSLSLIDRVRWLRLLLPPFLIAWVVTYQLGFAQALETAYGHVVHYGVEIAFYSLAGPAVTWLMLTWVERKLHEKELLEQQVQAAQAEKRAMLEEERARIARDLHDGVAQTLYFMALKTDVLRNRLAADHEAVAELHEVGRTARQVIREVRRTIFALRPLDWSELGFWPSLRQFIDGFAEQLGWQVTVRLDSTLDLPPALEPTLFRLVQESLNNVAKHAEASCVTVEIEAVDNGRWLTLTVRDDGRGLDPQAVDGHGFGLTQMRSRVAMAGGTFQIETQRSGGTAVTARLPYRVTAS